MGKAKRGAPEGWENYSNCGQQIPGSPFVAFKVPLRAGDINKLRHVRDKFNEYPYFPQYKNSFPQSHF